MAYAIAIPFFLLSGVLFFVLDPEYNYWHDIYIAIPAVLGGTIIFMKRAFEEWWHTKNPPRVGVAFRELLEKKLPYYQKLTPDNKESFERRVFLFELTKEFEVKGMNEVPRDIKLLVSATAVQVGAGIKDFNYPKLGMIVFFAKPFISPNLPTTLHLIEFNSEPDYDCIIMSMDAFVKGLKEPELYYNVGLHVFARSLQKELGIKDEDFNHDHYGNKEEFMLLLAKVRGFRTGYLPTITGFREADLFPVYVEHFFTVPERFYRAFPDLYEYIEKTLCQDPLMGARPVIYDVPESDEEVQK